MFKRSGDDALTQDVRVVKARKVYGSVAAVDDVSFEVKRGEVLTLLGPSGCGKTTTLRMIAGLEQGDGGEIYLGDRLLSAPARKFFVPPEQRSMGMVFQNYAVWPHMTVGENVAFPLKMKGMKASEIRDRTGQILETVGLAGLEDRPSPLLSGGQQQRVALARALVFEPEVLLLDEPLSNLDARLREELRFELKDLQRRLGITTIFVTHDQREAMVLSDRVIVMNAGHIEQEGPPLDIYQHPRTRFALEFLGAANYLPAQLTEAGALVPDAGGVVVPMSAEDLPTSAQDGQLSFRSEDVILERIDQVAGPWSGHILAAAFLGNQFEYVVALGSSRIHATGPKHDPIPEGSPVRVHIREDAHRFWAGENEPLSIQESAAAVV